MLFQEETRSQKIFVPSCFVRVLKDILHFLKQEFSSTFSTHVLLICKQGGGVGAEKKNVCLENENFVSCPLNP